MCTRRMQGDSNALGTASPPVPSLGHQISSIFPQDPTTPPNQLLIEILEEHASKNDPPLTPRTTAVAKAMMMSFIQTRVKDLSSGLAVTLAEHPRKGTASAPHSYVP